MHTQLMPLSKTSNPPLALLALPLVLASTPVHADVISLFPSADNTLYETATGSVSNGAGTAMFVGRNAQMTSSIRRALLRFDLAAIPAGSTITDVALTLVNSGSNPGTLPVTIHRASQSWGEGSSLATGAQGSGAPAEPGDATWLHRFFSATSWSTPGGDFDASPSAQTAVLGAGSYSWSSPGLVADIQAWLDAPASNLGWLMRGDDLSPSTAKRFSTREESDPSLRPTLIITYIPAPATAAPFALLAIGARRRRD